MWSSTVLKGYRCKASIRSPASASAGCGSLLPWNIFEPNRGHLNEPEIASLEEGLAALPKGTKVIVDVVNTPQWETGSSNPAMPPSNPADYARFAGAMAKRFAGRVAAWEIWNEEDASLWWASGPDPAAYTALLKAAYPADQSRRPERDGGARRADRQ